MSEPQPQPPFVILEGNTGVSAFATASEVTGHDWRGDIPPEEPLPQRQCFDARGHLLREDSSSGLELASQEDRTEYVRSEVGRRLVEALLKSEEENWSDIGDYDRKLLSDYIRDEGTLDFYSLAQRLTEVLQVPLPPPFYTVGTMWHRCRSPHHPPCRR